MKVGDKVQINSKFKHVGSFKPVGTIIYIDEGTTYPYKVDWGNFQTWYKKPELVLSKNYIILKRLCK